MSEKRTGEPLTVLSVSAKSKEVLVILSNGEKLNLSVDSFTEFHLYAGKVLEQKELEQLSRYASQDQAYEAAIKYLSRDSHSAIEVWRKLVSKDFDPTIVNAVVNRLKQSGLIDDAHYAKTYAEDVGDLRLIGYNRIVYDLRSKGIGEDILATLSFPREKELDKACRYATHLDRRYYRTPRGKRILKINHALLERGFDESIAHEAATSCVSEENAEVERAELEKAYALAEAKYSRKYEGYDLTRHIYAYLIRKGFPFEEAKSIVEEHKHD